MGKGDTEHYLAIMSDDLVKVYPSVVLNQNTFIGLVKKFSHTFIFSSADKGLKICLATEKHLLKVIQINGGDAVLLSTSETSKNHRDDNDAADGGVMPSAVIY